MTEPRWLSPEEMRAWLGYRRLRNLLDARIARDLADQAGLSDQDYDVLSNLSAHEDHRAGIGELAKELRWSHSRLSHHLTRMEKRGLVARESHPADARGAIVTLTSEGRSAIVEAAPGHVASVREHLIDVMTPEQVRSLGDIAEAVLGRLGEAR
ncbi:MarR family winged helix-turn-helix transcriptional regulator [Phytomonospora endophytica]|uniref:DNA-binding MarR family transcriptional regulator n=1 Tax=Phytomonospora endophytica TaxID=714109 RepID=A0A841FB13_9ACTN|nr:MarR family winged helix-turn-helix transcriptional regulator [Phytomonospora endophytica]MBB6032223.1 DNA-binding MarR family transcriptional regulator [Phytomonospora endophytica]